MEARIAAFRLSRSFLLSPRVQSWRILRADLLLHQPRRLAVSSQRLPRSEEQRQQQGLSLHCRRRERLRSAACPWGLRCHVLGLSSLNAVVLSNAGCGTGGGSGTVTSIGLVGTANQITVTGASPITSSGSWTLSIPNNPTLPGTTTGTFSGNLTGNVTGNASGTAATITGALALANTPLTTTQDILYDNAGALGRLPIVTSGQCLGNSGGVWTSLVCSGGSGITSLNTLTASSLTIAAGTGIGSIVLSGGNTITIPVDTTIIASIDQVHANLNFPTSTSTGVTALTFTSNTKPIAAYAAQMCFVMKTDTANPVSANIDSLGAKGLYEPDGTTPWPSGSIAAGQYFEGCYDGTVFRVVWPPTSGMVYPGAGIAVSTGSAWTTSLTAPTGSLVGTGQANTYTTGLQSLASADFLSPVHSADPGTCTAGQFEFNSTTPAFKGCTATNTWTAFAAGSTPSFPLTVAGTVTSGGIPYFNTTTQESSSALLALNHILLGGGAGGAPTSDAKLDDGATTANTLNYTGTGGFVASGGPVVAGSAIPSLAAGTGAFFGGVEGTAPTAGFPAAGYDGCSASSASHGLLCSFNNGTASLMALAGIANTFTAPQTISSTNLTFSGNISAAAWTTAGIRIKGVAATLTDTSSSGTVAAAYTNSFGGNTIAASSATTYTNYYNAYHVIPTAGTNVTFTHAWALGSDNASFGTSNPFQVATNGHVTVEGVTSTGATGTGTFVFANTPTLITPVIGAATGTSLLVTGIVDGKAPVTITTGATATLGAGTYNSGYTVNQEGTAGTGVTYTLPATATGLQYCVANSGTTGVVNTGVLTVYPASGSYVILNGVVNTIGGGGTHGVASGGAAGDSACFVAVDATHWQVWVGKGTWAEN